MGRKSKKKSFVSSVYFQVFKQIQLQWVLIYSARRSASGPRSAPGDYQDPFLANFLKKLWKAWKGETLSFQQLHHDSKQFGSSGKVSHVLVKASPLPRSSEPFTHKCCSELSGWQEVKAATFRTASRETLCKSCVFAPVWRNYVLTSAEKLPLVMSHRDICTFVHDRLL